MLVARPCRSALVPSCPLTQLDLSVHAEENVVTLDVSVDHLVTVEELQSLQTLGEGGEGEVKRVSITI